MEIIDSQSSSSQKESIPQEIIKFIVSIFKVIGHGLIVFFGFGFLNFYFLILEVNLWLGNYIIFLPILLVFLLPFVVIIVGAMNSYSVRYIYHRKTDETWHSLLIEGLLVCFIGFLFTVVWTVLIISFVGPQWPPFYMNFGLLFIIFYLLLLPSIGYTTKETTIVFFTRTKVTEQPSKFEK
ncbi:hypothetical protein E4H12_10035 [Candidatus Thorarchaeota archaeon]|nr:MAG: hypothetical protein E4H12_10035 [Candidatus Thorarchaeota archaeon]